MDYKEYFKNKKITQIGLGLLGRGLGDAIFLAECGADLIVTDMKSETELSTSVEKLKVFPNVTLHLGGHNLDDFKNRDFILKGAGVPLDSVYIEEAKKNNIPIEMDSSLFVKLLPKGVTTVGITGTRGKSTVTHLVYHVLKTSGKNVFLGGNVRDMATLPLINIVKDGDYVVLELDSWQLQGFGESKISPHIAVFTNIMEDHLNYYKNNPEQYFLDKTNIFKFQTEKDFLIVGDVLQNLESKSKQIKVSSENMPKGWSTKLLGAHNLANIACAIEACRALDINERDIKNGVENFEGVEGRLQFVKEISGVKVFNDNNATTPNAAVAAIHALGEDSDLILICGGADKNLDLSELVEAINKYCKTVIILPGSGTDKLKTNSQKLTVPIIEVSNLSEAIVKSFEFAVEGNTVLFSPAFASFGLFKNEYERNDEFLKIVESLK